MELYDQLFSNYITSKNTPIITPKIYGAEWDGTSSTTWTRTDDAQAFVNPTPYYSGIATATQSPFDYIMPWAGMKVFYDPLAGAVVSIPKFWFKWTRDGKKMKLQIANEPIEGFSVSPAHIDRGDGKGERDVVYIGRYHCADDYISKGGVTPVRSKTRATFRSGISGLGSNIWQNDYAIRMTIWLLYLVEYADWDSQKVIGFGCGTNTSVANMGYTDNMPYHTGTTKTSRDSYGFGTQYRYIEGLWDNVRDFVDGIYFSGADIYGILNPANFSDSTGGVKTGSRSTAASGYTSAWNTPIATGYEWMIYPSETQGGETTYIADYCYYNATGVVLNIGGNYGTAKYNGLFSLSGYGAATSSDVSLGSRLMILP